MMRSIITIIIIAAIFFIITAYAQTSSSPYTIIGSWHIVFGTSQAYQGGRIDTFYSLYDTSYTFRTPGYYSIAGNRYKSTGFFLVSGDSLLLARQGVGYRDRYLMHFTSENNLQLIRFIIYNKDPFVNSPDTVIQKIFLAR